MNRRMGIIIAALMPIFGFAIFNNDVHAADSSTILNKWNYTQYYNCAKSYFNKSPYYTTNETVLEEVVGEKGTLAMPSQGFQGASGTIDCKTLMTGRVGIQDVSHVSGDVGAVNALFSSLGYEAKAATGATATINYTYIKEGTVDAGSVPSTLKVTIDANGPVNSDDGHLKVSRIDANSFKICLATANVCTGRILARTDNMAALNNDIVRALTTTPLTHSSGNDVKFSADNFNVTTDSKPAGFFYPPSGKSVSEIAAETTKNFSGMGLSDLRLSDSELYTLYMSYLKNNASTIACGSSAGGGYAVKLKTTDGTFKQCKVDFGGKSPSSISVNTQKYGVYPYISSINMLNVLEWFNGANEAALTDIEDSLVPADGTIEPEEETQEEGEASADGSVDCQSSGAAGSLGWIICPILDWMTNASEYMYNTWIKNLLSISPQLFNNGEDGTRGAWTTFQSFSNIIFVIILLVVIISQITGAGIDNYGIKKILPKLIIAAILVNVSYFICQIAIDISNITGNSLQALFDGLPAAMPSSIEGIEINNTADGFVGVSLLVGLVGGVWTVFAGMELPIILLTLFSSAIGVVVSLFFLFIMLSVRQAIVVVLTVLSPIAVVLYVLPNSRQWFDRYLKMFGALLLLYPLCGLVVGGGNYVSKLLLSSGFVAQGLTAAFAAIVIGIAPIFLIPTLLRNSLNAIGGLGGRLSGISAGLSRGATRSVRDSDGYRTALNQAAKARNRALAGIDANGRPTRMGNLRARIAQSRLGRLTGFQGLQSARIAQANKDRESDVQASAELGELTQRYARAHGSGVGDETYFRNALREAVASGDQNRIFAVIEQMRRSNMQQSRMAALTRETLGGQELADSLGGHRSNFLNEFAKKYGGDFLKKDFEQADWARKGGINSANNASLLGVGGQWAASEMGVDDMKDDDVAALSSDRLHDLIESGRITQAQAQRVWASNSNMDDTNRLMMGAWANEGMNLTKQQAQAELNGNGSMSAEKVAAYTERAPGDVVIRDVRWKDKEGQHRQTDPLETTNKQNGP